MKKKDLLAKQTMFKLRIEELLEEIQKLEDKTGRFKHMESQQINGIRLCINSSLVVNRSLLSTVNKRISDQS